MDQDIRSDADSIGQIIRRHFVEGKSQQIGKKYSFQKKYNSPDFWRVAAQICIEINADPFSFVRSAFLFCSIPGGPFPNQLCGNAIRKWFQSYQKLNAKPGVADVYEAEILSWIQTSYFLVRNIAAANNLTFRDVLTTEIFVRTDNVPPFVRLLLLPNDPENIKMWGRAAYYEVMGNPKLLSILENKGYNLDFLSRIDREVRS